MKAKNFFEISVPDGLEDLAWQEITGKFGERAKRLDEGSPLSGVVQFTFGDDPKKLLGLKTALSLFWGRRFDVPRPRALLGHEHFTALVDVIYQVMALWPAGTFQSVYLAAAGSDSDLMQRLITEIASAVRLKVANEEGDLLLRVRRPLAKDEDEDAWDALVRMSPRPLSVRKWRVCDFEGALNAAVANALVMLTQPQPDDQVLNLACGSGTILIERAQAGPAGRLMGCDTNPAALACARRNAKAAGFGKPKHQSGSERPGRRRRSPLLNLEPNVEIEWFDWDARALPLEDASLDVLCADLPFGHDVGSHEENLLLYPHIIKEAARVAKPGGRAVFITHELRLMETVLNISPDWELTNILPVTINGLHPRLYQLTLQGSRAR